MKLPLKVSSATSNFMIGVTAAVIFVGLEMFLFTGLLILIITPVFRVGVSIIAFAKEKDYLYGKITTMVFIILVISFLLGKVE